MNLLLTAAEMAELTGYTRHADQRKWLQSKGWAFEVARTGRPMVARSYFDARMNKKLTPAAAPVHHFERLRTA
ncbi:MAG: DUF4224 domain-containing protein [Bradyrhizobium sp.]|nr:DUF4224 domain-containing protein [Bradyrhizobium sp.]